MEKSQSFSEERLLLFGFKVYSISVLEENDKFLRIIVNFRMIFLRFADRKSGLLAILFLYNGEKIGDRDELKN